MIDPCMETSKPRLRHKVAHLIAILFTIHIHTTHLDFHPRLVDLTSLPIGPGAVIEQHALKGRDCELQGHKVAKQLTSEPEIPVKCCAVRLGIGSTQRPNVHLDLRSRLVYSPRLVQVQTMFQLRWRVFPRSAELMGTLQQRWYDRERRLISVVRFAACFARRGRKVLVRTHSEARHAGAAMLVVDVGVDPLG